MRGVISIKQRAIIKGVIQPKIAREPRIGQGVTTNSETKSVAIIQRNNPVIKEVTSFAAAFNIFIG